MIRSEITPIQQCVCPVPSGFAGNGNGFRMKGKAEHGHAARRFSCANARFFGVRSLDDTMRGSRPARALLNIIGNAP